jgi:hypothetical protein
VAARGGGARGRTVFSSSVRLTGGPDFFTCLAMLALALPERASNRRTLRFCARQCQKPMAVRGNLNGFP